MRENGFVRRSASKKESLSLRSFFALLIFGSEADFPCSHVCQPVNACRQERLPSMKSPGSRRQYGKRECQ